MCLFIFILFKNDLICIFNIYLVLVIYSKNIKKWRFDLINSGISFVCVYLFKMYLIKKKIVSMFLVIYLVLYVRFFLSNLFIYLFICFIFSIESIKGHKSSCAWQKRLLIITCTEHFFALYKNKIRLPVSQHVSLLFGYTAEESQDELYCPLMDSIIDLK